MAVLSLIQGDLFRDNSLVYVLSLLIVLASLLYCSYVVLYRLYFHPLAKYPGPILARISPIPIAVSHLCGRLPFTTKDWHDKYGPVVRVSPNELSFDEEASWKDIYGSRPGHKIPTKDPIHVGSVETIPGVTTITMADEVNHARQRRALAYAFSTKALLEQEYIVRNYINVFSDKMQEYAIKGEAFNVVDWFAYTTFDIIGDMSLGEPFGCLTNEDLRFWVPLISETIKAGAIEQVTRRLATVDSTYQKFLQWCVPNSIKGTRKEHLTYSREKVLKRLAQTGSDHKDFLYYLIKQEESGNIDRNEIIVNGALFIVAGSETTAGYLSGLFNQLLRNRHILARLTEEIRTNFTAESEMDFESLVKLPYMTAVIEEGMRAFPPAPIGFLRTVPKGGDTIAGNWVPGGTSVSTCAWAATHSLRNFHKPYEFIPERWLDKDTMNDKLGASNAFSLGPRGCIGRNLSYMEIRLILGKLLWNSDVEMAGANEAWTPEGDHKNMKVYTNWMKPELMVKLTPRKN